MSLRPPNTCEARGKALNARSFLCSHVACAAAGMQGRYEGETWRVTAYLQLAEVCADALPLAEKQERRDYWELLNQTAASHR